MLGFGGALCARPDLLAAESSYRVSASLGWALPVRVHSLALLASLAACAALSWWIAASPVRSRRLAAHLRARPVVWGVDLFAILLGLYLVFDRRNPLFLLPLVAGALVALLALAYRRDLAAFLGGLALLSATSIVLVAVLEVVFRVFFLEPMVPTTEAGFEKRIASSWPRPIPIEKPAGSFRILGLTDSFGFAGGHQNYHYLLEDSLREAGLEVEVIDLAMYGTGPRRQLEMLRQFGTRYRPDLVLHGFYVGNDFDPDPATALIFAEVPVDWPQSFVEYPFRNLLLLEWTKRYVQALVEGRRVERERAAQGAGAAASPPDADGEEPPVYSRPTFLGIEFGFAENTLETPERAERWSEVAADLEAIRREAEAAGAVYVQVLHPARFQVEDELWREMLERYGADGERYDRPAPQRFLARWCAERKLACLDLLPAFRAVGSGLYLPHDSHFNLAGNRLAAAEIQGFLLRQGLLPRAPEAPPARGRAEARETEPEE